MNYEVGYQICEFQIRGYSKYGRIILIKELSNDLFFIIFHMRPIGYWQKIATTDINI